MSSLRNSKSSVDFNVSNTDPHQNNNNDNGINPFADEHHYEEKKQYTEIELGTSGQISKSRSTEMNGLGISTSSMKKSKSIEGGLGASTSSMKKSKSMDSVEFIQEPQIPLYFSMVKEKERRRELKLRKRIKKKFKKGPKPSVSSPESASALANASVIESIPSDLTSDHAISIEDLASKYQTNINFQNPKNSYGLSSEKAEEFLERDGRNALTPTKPTPKWVKYVKEYLGLFPLMLEIGGILSFIAYGLDKEVGGDSLYLGIILWIVVIVTCTFSYFQTAKSASVMEGFKKLASSSTKVIRDGQLIEIDSEILVVGDIVVIRAGDKIPADIRIILSNHLKVDNSSLTGESEPQTRTPNCTDENPLETQNLAFYGTLACAGDAIGVIIATGDRTTIGKIASLASKSKPASTPMKREIQQFIKAISIVAITLGLTFLVIGFSRKVQWIYVVIFTIGVIVSQVPEGMLPTLTVTLNITAKRMARKNVLVKNLLTVETLGSTKTIASDKTGTLTQNIMTVVHLWYDETVYSCNSLAASNFFNTKSTTFQRLFMISALCNRTVFDKGTNQEDIPIQQRKTIGDASESALLKFCEQIENVEQFRDKYPKLFEIPFNSLNKWQLSVHEDTDGTLFLAMKGAPERIINICSKIMINGEEHDINSSHLDNFQKSYEFLAGKGERALGMAFLQLDPKIYTADYPFDADEKNFPTSGLVFIGLTTLMDPPRPGVPEAIQTCKEAGIRVMMVTGDHPLTAASIAKQVGIIEVDETLNDKAKAQNVDLFDLEFAPDQAVVIPGSMLDDLTHEQWDKILSLKQIVFARTSPEQKLIIVEKCQKRGDIVAVTGDGVNDSPALKKSDLGCAMGITGSEVAKEAASIVLLDDNFSSIVAGVEEGRIIFDKLKKSICYTLSSNIPEVLPFFCFFVLQMPVALSGILILCIDLGTDLLPVFSYAYEASESEMMKRKPRDVKKDRLVSLKLALFSYVWLGTVQCAAGFLNYFLTFRDYGFSPSDIYNVSSDYFMNTKAEPYQGSLPGAQVYDAKEQADILLKAQTAYFVAIVLTRVGAALSCKTRKNSIFVQGFRNNVFNAGIITMISLALIIVHVPGIRVFFGCTIISYKYWLLPLPFAVFLVTVNEIRLYMIRNLPKKSKFRKMIHW
ncbi:hypothetical protein CYY_001231 [Polysphondylium violaceum]|uniref:Cation-transporting P-type ATPase N-terminal domain-containing protein n=1 Tax=Polysphondylium violaceum TaxID=133409 RepID=A0A8J4V4F2_9MYCE|nr:hypothetical protein CYY_001231 [Polysphondylium violaceum]